MKLTNDLQTTLQTVASYIKNAKNIVLMPHAKMDCDGMSASVALHLILNKFGKHSTTVCADPVPEAFAFLPSSDIFSTEITAQDTQTKQFHLRVNDTDNKFKNLEYSIENGKINIILFSENTPFQEEDFSFIGAQLKPDLIITLDSGDTLQLGKIYEDNKPLFEEVPVINIDHHFSNTHFGDINLVNHTSCSTTQLIYTLIPFLQKEFNNTNQTTEILDKNISTLLLAGMLTDTGSFQHSNTTPEALDIASILIDHGAEHQKIVKHLFKTKSVQTLKIWGKILTKLQQDPRYKIVWSHVSKNDLEETGASSDDTNDLIDDLMATTPNTELVLLVKEREDNIISTSVRSASDDIDSVAFTSIFGGGGHKQAAGFKIRERGGKSFEEIVADIVYEAKVFQAKRLHIPLPKRGLVETRISEDQKEANQKEVIKTPPSPSMPEFPLELEKMNTIEEKKGTEPNNTVPQPPVQTVSHPAPDQIQKTKIPNETIHTITIEPTPEDTPQSKKSLQENISSNTHNVPPLQNTTPDEKNLIENLQELSEEEIPYAKHKESFKMPTPEKYIEKPAEEETNYDDFADFLAKADDNEDVEYLTETETSNITAPTLNPYHTNTNNKETIPKNTQENMKTTIDEQFFENKEKK